jgi:phosphoribosylformylglycinamidine (FGAM) synthase PurS component
MTARVFVSLKPTVLDPQGQTIRNVLNSHGHPEVF